MISAHHPRARKAGEQRRGPMLPAARCPLPAARVGWCTVPQAGKRRCLCLTQARKTARNPGSSRKLVLLFW